MRHTPLLIITLIVVLASSCGQQSRGQRHLTSADSLRRARAIAEEAHLNDMEQLHEELTGPAQAEGSGAVTRGGAVAILHPGDSAAILVKAHERWHRKLEQALSDSATVLGALITRVLVQDSTHRYTTATYTGDGHLLAFHSEYTPDEHHRYEYDLCFDHGRLVHLHERHLYAGDMDEEEQAPDTYTDDMYYLAAGHVVYSYRDEGEVAHHMDHIEYIPQGRHALAGDVPGRVYHAYSGFEAEYNALQQQPMEMIVYTAGPKEAVHPEVQ